MYNKLKKKVSLTYIHPTRNPFIIIRDIHTRTHYIIQYDIIVVIISHTFSRPKLCTPTSNATLEILSPNHSTNFPALYAKKKHSFLTARAWHRFILYVFIFFSPQIHPRSYPTHTQTHITDMLYKILKKKAPHKLAARSWV